MTSRDSSTKPGSAAAEALVANVADQRALRPDPPVRSVEEFAEFLAQVEAVVGADDRPRPPTVGRFRL
jgi:hypothetical protein